ncbi:MAG: hypothetical protein JWR77_249, partial [Rhizorhabdus sp.]|nr:hypothetical protein [Rhizorhabdus sp.]
EIHGRMPPTALFALPLAYGFPFQFGFVNFTLAIAMMFIGIGLWLRLRRTVGWRLRAAIFVPFAFALFIAHSVAWGMFGLVIFAIEMIAARDEHRSWPHAVRSAALACLPLAPPLLLMVDWWLHRSEDVPISFSDWRAKFYYLSAVLRSDHEQFDLLGARLLMALAVLAMLGRGMAIDRLGAAALALFAAFLAMPSILMGASYADMRIAPYALALALLGIAPRIERRLWLNLIAAGGLIFFGSRLAADGWSYAKLDRNYRAQLAALDHMPMGARIFAMADIPCPDTWSQPRIDHLGALAIVRRDAFVNGQWAMPGGRLLSVRYAPANGFALDPTQFLEPETCRKIGSYSLEQTLALLPRKAFDYLWLIDLPPERWPHDLGLVPVWHGRRGIMYRIVPPVG